MYRSLNQHLLHYIVAANKPSYVDVHLAYCQADPCMELQVLLRHAIAGSSPGVQLPRAFVEKAQLQKGPIEIWDEAGHRWESKLREHYSKSTQGSAFKMHRGWSVVAAALQLREQQVICISALGKDRILISREGEEHFQAVSSHEDSDPWPITTVFTRHSLQQF